MESTKSIEKDLSGSRAMDPLLPERRSPPWTASTSVDSATLHGNGDRLPRDGSPEVREANRPRKRPVAVVVPDSVVRERGLDVPLSRDGERRAERERDRETGVGIERQPTQTQIRTTHRDTDERLQRDRVADLPQRTAGERRAPAPCRLVGPARDVAD